MDTPQPENPGQAMTPRRDLLKLAVATGAGLAFSTLPQASQAAGASPEAEPNSLPADHSYKLRLNAVKPRIDNAGGSVAEGNKTVFPAGEKGGASIYLLKLAPGGLREPHWHPNCWEMDYVVSGQVEMTIVTPDGHAQVFTLEAGDAAFVPQGYAHSILNTGTVEAVIPIVFNDALPDDLGLSTMYGKFPVSQFTQTFGVPASAMAGIPQPKETLFIVPKV